MSEKVIEVPYEEIALLAETEPEVLIDFARRELGIDLSHALSDPTELVEYLLSLSEGWQ
jgi:hypothetical protein